MQLTTEQALQLINKSIVKAKALGIDANIAILDTGGHMKTFVRMDNAFLGSIDIAMGKARTAMLFRMNSESVGTYLDPAMKTYGMIHTSGGLVGFRGGMPIIKDGAIVAYVGVSGGSPDQDFEIATAGSKL